jgi:Fe-Mn family superoxide dismutase
VEKRFRVLAASKCREEAGQELAGKEIRPMAHNLPPLPYPFDALEPYIDAKTMEIHHDKHHGAYVTNLNKALEGHPEFQKISVEELNARIGNVPEAVRTAVRNNGGGHLNHSMFWKIMKKGGGGEPSGDLADAIRGAFGNFGDFKKTFAQAAMSRFGSGWAWLLIRGGELTVESTANQDNPAMDGGKAFFGLDVWEHAYYLRYQNRRAEYIEAWWNTVDWAQVSGNFAHAKA